MPAEQCKHSSWWRLAMADHRLLDNPQPGEPEQLIWCSSCGAHAWITYGDAPTGETDWLAPKGLPVTPATDQFPTARERFDAGLRILLRLLIRHQAFSNPRNPDELGHEAVALLSKLLEGAAPQENHPCP